MILFLTWFHCQAMSKPLVEVVRLVEEAIKKCIKLTQSSYIGMLVLHWDACFRCLMKVIKWEVTFSSVVWQRDVCRKLFQTNYVWIWIKVASIACHFKIRV
jgi:hypothetical protein